MAEAEELGHLVRRGVAWSALNSLSSRVAGFLVGLVVARLVAPADFGVFAIALVVYEILVQLSELGTGAVLLRDDRATVERRAPTVFSIGLVASAVAAGGLALAAPTLARLGGAPEAASALAVMSLVVLVAGSTAVPVALLRRDFSMHRLLAADAAFFVASSTVVLVLGAAGWGPMALAWSRVAGQVASAAMLFLLAPRRYRPGFDRHEARAMLVFGLPLAGASLVAYAIQNIDYVVVANVLGTVPLGLYVLAFNISGWPTGILAPIVRSVALPGFARLDECGVALSDHFARAVGAVAKVTFPACATIAVLAQPLVRILYGPKWAGAVSAVVWLSVVGALRIIAALFHDVLIALGRTRRVLAVQILWLSALGPTLAIGARMGGLPGVGAAHALVACAVALPAYLWAIHKAGVNPTPACRALAVAMLWACGAGAGSKFAASAFANPWVGFAAGGSVGALVTLAAHGAALRRAMAGLRAARPARVEGADQPSIAGIRAGSTTFLGRLKPR